MEKVDKIKEVFESLRFKGVVKTQKDFAKLLDYAPNNLSKAMNGNEAYLTDSLMARVKSAYDYYNSTPTQEDIDQEMVLVIPTGARAGTLADFASSISAYDCERMVTPIKGADYAIQVTGDSMSPEYPSGSMIIIKIGRAHV